MGRFSVKVQFFTFLYNWSPYMNNLCWVVRDSESTIISRNLTKRVEQLRTFESIFWRNSEQELKMANLDKVWFWTELVNIVGMQRKEWKKNVYFSLWKLPTYVKVTNLCQSYQHMSKLPTYVKVSQRNSVCRIPKI